MNIKLYVVPKPFVIVTIAHLVIAGIVFIASAIVQWQVVQIQTLLGNYIPLTQATIEMGGGMIYMILVWFWLTIIRHPQNQ